MWIEKFPGSSTVMHAYTHDLLRSPLWFDKKKGIKKSKNVG